MNHVTVFCKNCKASHRIVEDGVCPGCKREICTFCGSSARRGLPALIRFHEPGLCAVCFRNMRRLSHELMKAIVKEAA
jgi:hypothetical protein